MANPQTPEATTPISELRVMGALIEDISESLKKQKAILKQRGVNLPPMVLQSLGEVRKDLNGIESMLVDEHTELQQLRALADMSANISTSLDVQTVLKDAMEIVIALTQAERGHIILIDEQTGEHNFAVSSDSGALLPSTGADAHKEVSQTVLNEVLETGIPLLADNAYKDERLQGNLSIASLSLRSVLCVPLKYKDNTIGAVYVDNRLQAGIFTEREKNLLMAFANTAAVAIANARLYASTERMLVEITSVKDLMDNVFNSIESGVIATNVDHVVHTFTRAAEKILNKPSVEVFGQSIESVFKNVTAHLDEMIQLVQETQEVHTRDAEYDSDKGSVVVSMKLSPLKDEQDNSQGVTLVLDDVTSQKAHEQQIGLMKTYLPPEMVDQIHDIAQIDLGGGARREVTCIFADVRPLSTMPDVRPSELLNVINTFQSVASECIHQAGGIIDKYMGNEVMALFNTQINPLENHAQHAVEAALLMRERFEALYEELGINPDPHFYIIGMHTGEATLGNVGSINRREFTAIGDTINLSKRVEENASQGSITISEDTRRHLEANNDGNLKYHFEEIEPIQAKGRTELTQAYEVFRSS